MIHFERNARWQLAAHGLDLKKFIEKMVEFEIIIEIEDFSHL